MNTTLIGLHGEPSPGLKIYGRYIILYDAYGYGVLDNKHSRVNRFINMEPGWAFNHTPSPQVSDYLKRHNDKVLLLKEEYDRLNTDMENK